MPRAAHRSADPSTAELRFSRPGRARAGCGVKADDQPALLHIFGPDGKELVSSGDPQQDAQDRQTFPQKYVQAHRLVREPSGMVMLYIGAESWPFRIPLTEAGGRWSFDTDAGKQEILMRRIGRNELTAIELCQELVAAQKEHFAGAHPGEVGQYAPYFVGIKFGL